MRRPPTQKKTVVPLDRAIIPFEQGEPLAYFFELCHRHPVKALNLILHARPQSPLAANALGVAVILQELSLIDLAVGKMAGDYFLS